ncbi:MAG: response regulator [Sandaracinaceae bacterium]|nr:response regulator [Sandaracinaceae bacterium]
MSGDESCAGEPRVRTTLRGERPRVLVLEDDAAVRRAWEGTAQAAGVSLRVAASEREARTWLAAEAFDLVLCDLHLEGSETSVALVRELACARVPLVAVVSGDPKAAIGALGLSVPVFAKPVRLRDVLEELGLAGG